MVRMSIDAEDFGEVINSLLILMPTPGLVVIISIDGA